MSHWTKTKTVIKDLESLGVALHFTKAGTLEIARQGQRLPCRGYQGAVEQVDAVLRGARYDMGFRRLGDGTHEVVTDWWARQYQEHHPLTEQTMPALLKEYATQVVLKQARTKGLVATRSQNQDGSVTVRVRVPVGR